MMPSAPTSADLLAVHEDPRTLLDLKRVVTRGELGRFHGHHSVDAALEWLARAPEVRAVLLHWLMPDHDALRFMCEIERLERRPAVLAFALSWHQDDLRRALQSGVDGVLRAPLVEALLTADLAEIARSGEGRSRQQLLAHAAPLLLAHDDALWALDVSPEWLERMMALAHTLRRRHEAHARVGDDVVVVLEWAQEALRPELVDVGRLRELVLAASARLVRLDHDRLRALLPAQDAVERLDAAAVERLRRLQAVVEQAVDQMRLLQLREELAPVLACVPGIDHVALRAVLPPAPPGSIPLPPDALMRLRVLAAVLALSRTPTARDRALESFHRLRGLTVDEARVLDSILEACEDQPARQALTRLVEGWGRLTVDAVRAALEAGELDAALDRARSLPAEEPRKAELLNDVGVALRSAGRPHGAVKAYLGALKLLPDAPALLFNLARVKHELGADDEALALVDRVLSSVPDLDRARRLRAEILGRSSDR